MIKDELYIKGYVTLTLKDESGTILNHHKGNQIVYIGRHRLLRLACGDSLPSGQLQIDTLKVASGAVEDGGDHLSPQPVSQTDSGMFETDPTAIINFNLPAPTYNPVSSTTVPKATFSLTITAAETNSIVNELGLFFGVDGPMFAHFSFPTVDLRSTTNNSLEIIWELTF